MSEPTSIVERCGGYIEGLRERFWKKVSKGEAGECWEWGAYRNSKGYGTISVEGKKERAHRVAYFLEREAPGEDYILHKCDNPSCVNPNHLYAGTLSDNMRDAINRGRLEPPTHKNGRNGEANPNAKLTTGDVTEIKSRVGGDETHSKLAAEYGVSQSTISMVVSGGRWGDDG